MLWEDYTAGKDGNILFCFFFFTLTVCSRHVYGASVYHQTRFCEPSVEELHRHSSLVHLNCDAVRALSSEKK